MAEKTIDHELEAQGLRLVSDHILRVQMHMHDMVDNLIARLVIHDQSKFSPQEIGLVLSKPALDKHPYMSREERDELTGIQDSLNHHYANNTHHPEHHKNAECGSCFKQYPIERVGTKCDDCMYDIWENTMGIDGMSLLDLLEMACDWKAASEVSPGGSFAQSIEYGHDRFNMSTQLVRIFENTMRELDW